MDQTGQVRKESSNGRKLHVFSGANSNLGNCVAIRISIMKARSRNGSLG
ncbi:hypothetical protein HanPSC8_Chr10g0440931 [Helianthus annuus]|nr:hypothetical protein HanPSC8_Chr10g0440931 [Helianthus annuus]